VEWIQVAEDRVTPVVLSGTCIRSKVKVKMSLGLTKHNAMKRYGKVEV
jgi:hypothetical protein